ncbi:MAG: PIN domain-containing protein, partial [Nanoarchaeota archaeon]|nr:PIN domain-containing protein [Nanoarchaeota archaeon]
MIVDTCFIIDIMNNDESALASLDRLEHGAEPIILTSLNVFELYSGIAQSKVPEKEKEKVEAILDTQTVIS